MFFVILIFIIVFLKVLWLGIFSYHRWILLCCFFDIFKLCRSHYSVWLIFLHTITNFITFIFSYILFLIWIPLSNLIVAFLTILYSNCICLLLLSVKSITNWYLTIWIVYFDIFILFIGRQFINFHLFVIQAYHSLAWLIIGCICHQNNIWKKGINRLSINL